MCCFQVFPANITYCNRKSHLRYKFSLFGAVWTFLLSTFPEQAKTSTNGLIEPLHKKELMFQGSEDLITMSTICTPSFVSVHQLPLFSCSTDAIQFQGLFSVFCYLFPSRFWLVWSWLDARFPPKPAWHLSPQQDRGEKILTKGLWVKIRMRRDDSPDIVTGKEDLAWGKLVY